MVDPSPRRRKLEATLVKALARRTHFSQQEVEGLLNMFRFHAKGNTINRFQFRCFLMDRFGITEDIIMDRMFTFFDTTRDDEITREEWVISLNIVLKGTLEEQIAYTFFIYDINQDGVISEDEMRSFLRRALFLHGPPEEAEDGVKDLVQMTRRKLDEDKDDMVSFQDFAVSVRRDPTMMMEVLGACFPTDKVVSRVASNLLTPLRSRNSWLHH
jgi:Ca2+-binding EF-hand superfamily protein